jgi:hypothetical protein
VNERTVCVNEIDTLVNKHRHVVFRQLLMSQLRAVCVRFVFDHETPNFRLSRRIHDKVACVGWAVDEHCWSLFDEEILSGVVAFFETDAASFPKVKDFETRFSEVVEEEFPA